MSDTGNVRNESFGKQPCVEVANPSGKSFQTEDSMESTITISQFMPTVKEVSKQHSIEEITAKILQQKGTVVQSFIEIGFLLIEAKEQLVRHGQWLPWLKYNVDISERMAERYMQLAKAYGNSTLASDLGITKALILLTLPEADREAFINEPHEIDGQMLAVREMTTRETRKAVRNQCSPAVKSGETYKTFQPIRKDSARNSYNEKQDMLLNLAEDINSEINSAKTHLDRIISLLEEQKHNAETDGRLTKEIQLLQKKISQCLALIERKNACVDFS